MTTRTDMTEVQATTRGNDGTHRDDGAVARQFDDSFRVGLALATCGLDLDTLSPSELSELEANVTARLSSVIDEVVERWQDEHAQLTDQEKIDRELRQRISSEKDAIAAYHDDWECDGCGYRYYDRCAFVDFHGLFLCDGCESEARDELRDLQRSLIETLEAEPTLEHARALGFELTRRDDGRLVWISDDDDYDGGSFPYSDETTALEDLVSELG